MEVVASVILKDTIGLESSIRLSVLGNARIGQVLGAAVDPKARAEAFHARDLREGQQVEEEAGGIMFSGIGVQSQLCNGRLRMDT